MNEWYHNYQGDIQPLLLRDHTPTLPYPPTTHPLLNLLTCPYTWLQVACTMVLRLAWPNFGVWIWTVTLESIRYRSNCFRRCLLLNSSCRNTTWKCQVHAAGQQSKAGIGFVWEILRTRLAMQIIAHIVSDSSDAVCEGKMQCKTHVPISQKGSPRKIMSKWPLHFVLSLLVHSIATKEEKSGTWIFNHGFDPRLSLQIPTSYLATWYMQWPKCLPPSPGGQTLFIIHPLIHQHSNSPPLIYQPVGMRINGK